MDKLPCFTEWLLIESGLESEVYLVKDPQGKNLILKQRKPTGKHNYLFEAYVYEALGKRGARVPEVIGVTNERLVMTQLSGQEMDDREELFHNTALFRDIARSLSKCREMRLHGFGHVVQSESGFTGQYATWQSFLLATEKLFDSKNITNSGLAKNELTRLQDFWTKTVKEIDLSYGMLVHGDFALSAIFVDDEKFTGIIDFGDAFIGDPLMDIAYFKFKEITKSYGTQLYVNMLKAYEQATGLQLQNDETERRITCYMICWGLQRILHCPDDRLKLKFVEKLREVSRLC